MKIVTADVVTWGKIQPLGVVMIPIVFTVHVPLRESSLQVLCELVRDAALVQVTGEQVAVVFQEQIDDFENPLLGCVKSRSSLGCIKFNSN
jgi:hypothetical protein